MKRYAELTKWPIQTLASSTVQIDVADNTFRIGKVKFT